MNYLVAFVLIVVFHLTASALVAISGQDYEFILASVAIGGLAMLAGDYYTSKEGR